VNTGATPEFQGSAQADEIFKLLVNSVKDYAIFVLDPNGYVQTWNEGAKRFKGYSADEIIGQHFSIFYLKEARDSGHPDYELVLAKKNGRYEEEGRRVRKDGTTFWANVVITSLLDQNGKHLGFAKVTRDLTERKLAEEEKNEVNKRLQQQLTETEKFRAEAEESRDEALRANALKSQFVANISHEIRTPMSGILGLTELLIQETEGEAKETAEFIFSSAKDLMHIVNDLLDMSKLEAGKIEIRNQLFHIDQIIDDVLTAFYISANQKKIKLIAKVDDTLKGDICGDGYRARQVLHNLVQNAIKFTDTGSIEVSAQPERRDETHQYVRFSVHDTGPGIAVENQKQLFKLFVQLDGSATRRHGGTGLGLALSKRLVELMGGVIGVDSTPGHGSTFWFTLPFKIGADAECST
jgi:osomolarity two-component system, sensor histidine kinase TcsA